ncbi:MAG: Rrf2 family transcriptional regulator [Candidatus Rokubacteria bacterium]|nr:Rrf2 family transcriptional regulator [Candidatus Rokubacteria bacterium]
MQLTREGDYAVRVMVELAGAPRAIVPGRVIQQRQAIPPAHLAKVVQALRRAGLVRTWRGAGGGVTLALAPAEITLRRVIAAVEGPLYLNRCLIGPGVCPRDRICPVYPVWRRVEALLFGELDGVTMADLAQGGCAIDQAPRPGPRLGSRGTEPVEPGRC